MKICVPTQEDKGINSSAYGHFGSAPYFFLYDTDSGKAQSVANANQHHAHGLCHPMAALGGQSVDVVIVGGIGIKALDGLHTMGIRVYQAKTGTVQDNVTALIQGTLAELTAQNACGGHGHGSGCGHS
jgi:predicted Fe-Mo cluster-binding NifX family protein